MCCLGQRFVICSFCFRAVKRQFTQEKNENLWQMKTIIVIYATRFCANWVFQITREREARLKYERSKDFKASRAIRKAQFAQKRVAYKLLLFETTPQSFQIYLKWFRICFWQFWQIFREMSLWMCCLGQRLVICYFLL
jgi:hypothetical protein